jgi:WD40 repeat protein
LHGAIEHCTILCSEENSWFRVRHMHGMSGHEHGLVKIVVEVDTTRLAAGQHYSGWLEVAIAQAQVRVQVTVIVSATTIAPTSQSRRRRFWCPILMALLLLGGALFLPSAVRLTAQTDQLLFQHLVQRPSSDFNTISFAVTDGHTLALHLTDVTTGSEQRLGITGWSPAWSPDGVQLIFLSNQSGATQLYLMPTSGGAPKALTSSAEAKSMPIWSPDGSKIAYLAGLPHQGLLRVLDSHTFAWGHRAAALVDSAPLIAAVNHLFGRPGQLGEPVGFTRHFAWSPDGQTLLFDFYREETVQLLHMDAKGVATVVAADSWSPAWSPDGKTIAAVSAKGLFRLTLGSEKRHYLSPRRAQALAWSPTGKTIAVLAPQRSSGLTTTEKRQEPVALWLIDAIDGQETLVAADGVAFAWSPDGRQLAYVTGDKQTADPLLYLWLWTPSAHPTLLAEVGSSVIAWKPTP